MRRLLRRRFAVAGRTDATADRAPVDACDSSYGPVFCGGAETGIAP
jgi:hypothetical protein